MSPGGDISSGGGIGGGKLGVSGGGDSLANEGRRGIFGRLYDGGGGNGTAFDPDLGRNFSLRCRTEPLLPFFACNACRLGVRALTGRLLRALTLLFLGTTSSFFASILASLEFSRLSVFVISAFFPPETCFSVSSPFLSTVASFGLSTLAPGLISGSILVSLRPLDFTWGEISVPS